MGVDGGTTDIGSPKRWVHLVGTYENGAGARLYIDGAPEASNPSASGLISATGDDPVTIGAQVNAGLLRRFWKGQIDEVRLYNRALNPADVSELYQYVNERPEIIVLTDPVLDTPTYSLQLTATAADDGNPLPANPADPDPNDPNKLRWGWSTVSIPPNSVGVAWSGNPHQGEAFTYEGSANPPGTPFVSDPTASFDLRGVYTFEFAAGDGDKTAGSNVTVCVDCTGNYREAGYLYVSPLPEAEYSSPQTRFVLVRFEEISPSDVTNVTEFILVAGEASGFHAGQTTIAGDGRTVIFEMTADFVPHELVTVMLSPTIGPGAGSAPLPYSYQFMISGPMPDAPPAAQQASGAYLAGTDMDTTTRERSRAEPDADSRTRNARILANGVSVPSDFPFIDITVNDNPDPGYIFLDKNLRTPHYNIIFDNDGLPIWYRKMPDERRDMKVQPNGRLMMLARVGGDRFVGWDTNYVEKAEYRAVNGYTTDEHELQVLADGTYFLIGLRHETVDMTRYLVGADPNALVEETVIQEFTPAGELVFQWRAWDHYDVRDVHLSNPLSANFDFPHMNAIDVDEDGHILVSSRHLSEVTKIDRDTGEIIWRLGGAHSDFTFPDDPLLDGFRNQHSIRSLGAGRYLLFDNGNLRDPPMSRAVEYELDTVNMTATLVWQFPETPSPDIYAYRMGHVQRLPNGNTLINWSAEHLPKLTEARPDGTVAYEMNWVDQYETYRVSRSPWQGAALTPYLVIEQTLSGVRLIYNQFGNANVDHYRIYGGTSPEPTTLIGTSTATLTHVTDVTNAVRNYFRVTSVSTGGAESDYSNEESLVVRLVVPGENMVFNGDFSDWKYWWSWDVDPPAVAEWLLESGVSRFAITNGGTYPSDVQLRQDGLQLLEGREYTLEFDARAVQPRIFEAQLVACGPSAVSYSGIAPFTITPVNLRYSFTFTMEDPTDTSACLVFNAGSNAADVYIDNVSLILHEAPVVPSDGMEVF